MSKCSRIFEALTKKPNLTIPQLARETKLPEDAIVYVIEKSHPEKFVQTMENSNTKAYSLRC